MLKKLKMLLHGVKRGMIKEEDEGAAGARSQRD